VDIYADSVITQGVNQGDGAAYTDDNITEDAIGMTSAGAATSSTASFIMSPACYGQHRRSVHHIDYRCNLRQPAACARFAAGLMTVRASSTGRRQSTIGQPWREAGHLLPDRQRHSGLCFGYGGGRF
jgi:hypothetical protein